MQHYCPAGAAKVWHRRPAVVLPVFALAITAVALIAVGPARAQPSPSTAPAAADLPVEKLIERLGHPHYEVRNQAITALCSLDDQALPRLVDAYRAARSHEVHLALRHAIEYLFYHRCMQGRMGFMGVALPLAPSTIFDLQTGKNIEAIVLQRVLPNFPAEKAGVKTGDIIVEYEGRPLREVLAPRQPPAPAVPPALEGNQRGRVPTDPRLDAFTAEIAQRQPGSTIRLRVLRCGSEVRTVRLTVAADRAKTLEGLNLAPTLVATTAGRAGVGEITGAYTGAGLAVAGLAAGTRAAETGLAVGDVVVGFGGEPLRTGNSPALLYETVKTLPPGTELNLDVIRVASVPLSVTLGGRPVDRMNEQDLMVARMQFADWWRAETGEQSIVRDPIRMMWPVPPNQVPAAAAGPAVLP